MRGRSFLITTSVALVAALAACAPAETDWQAAQEDANAFASRFETDPDTLAYGSFSTSPIEPLLDDEPALLFEFAENVRIDEIRVACFGGGTAIFGVASRSSSNWVGVSSLPVPCDGEGHVVPIDGPLEGVNAIDLNGGIQSGDGAVLVGAVLGAVE